MGEDQAVQVANAMKALAALDRANMTKGLARFLERLDTNDGPAVRAALEAAAGLYDKDADLGEASAPALAVLAARGGLEAVELGKTILYSEPQDDHEIMVDLAVSLEKGASGLDGHALVSYLGAVSAAVGASAGSAEYLAYKLPARMAALGRDGEAYAGLVERTVSVLGTAAVGFCIRRLPRLVLSRGLEWADQKVLISTELAASHGRWAGVTLLLSKTKAARRMMSK